MTEPLKALTARWLMENPFPARRWVVEGLVPTGLTMLVGDPKIGKSWTCLMMGIAVSEGEPFWDMPTTRGQVLYLCLEDTYLRIQERMWKLAEDGSEGFFLCNESASMACGLCDQIAEFKAEHPEVSLVIIDTFQMVRNAIGGNQYASDYADMGELKAAADELGVAVVCIHHTNKNSDAQGFGRVNGSNGMTGTADTNLLMENYKGSERRAVLHVKGRDVETFSIELAKSPIGCWEYVGRLDEDEFDDVDVPEAVIAVADLLGTDGGAWSGLTSELAERTGGDAAALGKQILSNRAYLAARGYKVSRKRSSRGTVLTFARVEGSGSSDGSCSSPPPAEPAAIAATPAIGEETVPPRRGPIPKDQNPDFWDWRDYR